MSGANLSPGFPDVARRSGARHWPVANAETPRDLTPACGAPGNDPPRRPPAGAAAASRDWLRQRRDGTRPRPDQPARGQSARLLITLPQAGRRPAPIRGAKPLPRGQTGYRDDPRRPAGVLSVPATIESTPAGTRALAKSEHRAGPNRRRPSRRTRVSPPWPSCPAPGPDPQPAARSPDRARGAAPPLVPAAPRTLRKNPTCCDSCPAWDFSAAVAAVASSTMAAFCWVT